MQVQFMTGHNSLTLLLFVLLVTSCARADEPLPMDKPMPETLTNLNLRLKTLGGRQFWGDVHYFRGWRIQHNVFTGHYRLLDANDVRQAWGTEDQCLASLEKTKQDRGLKPMTGRVVIAVHGIIRSSKSFDAMRKRLYDDGVTFIGFDYPSTRVPITDSAKYLDRMLKSLDGVEQIDFVVHSMGGLVVRSYLQQAGETPEGYDKRISRMVMLGVPNLGARMASILEHNSLFNAIFGPAGDQLVEDPKGFITQLPTPPFEFAIVSGARGTEEGWNPVIPGDDDGTVSVDSTMLPGAKDSITFPVLHTFLMSHPEVMSATLRFLDTGSLRKEGDPQPIEK